MAKPFMGHSFQMVEEMNFQITYKYKNNSPLRNMIIDDNLKQVFKI